MLTLPKSSVGGKSKSLGGATSASLRGGKAKLESLDDMEEVGALFAGLFVEPLVVVGVERSGPKSKGGACIPSISPPTPSKD